MTLNFNTNGNDKQKECAKYWIDQTTLRILYGGSKGSAKSNTGCNLIFGDAFIYPGIHCFIARKDLNDLRKFTRPSIHEVFDLWGVNDKYYTFNGQDNFYQLYNGSKVFLIAAKYMPSDPKYTRFGSMQMTRGWIEEAGEFEKEATNNLFASVGRWKNSKYNLKGKLLETGNPSKNYLYTDYYKPFIDGKLPDWCKFIQALPTDNKMLPAEYVENLLKVLSPNEIERLVKGNWEFDDNPLSIYEYNNVCDMFTNSFIKGNGKKYLSADIAYLGADVFVISIWNGFVVEKVICIDKIDETAIGNKLIEIAQQYSIPYSNIVYDADGLRKFAANSLKRLTSSKPFVNNSQSLKDKNYANLKTECAFKLKELMESNQIFISCNDYRKQIMADLEQVNRQQLDNEGKIRLESKKDYKIRTNRSLDFFDSLLMRMIFELKTQGGWA